MGQLLDFALVHLVLVDDALDEALLSCRAVPLVSECGRLGHGADVRTISLGRRMAGVVTSTGSAVLVVRDESDGLDFLIDGVLQKLVELAAFAFDLGEIREFDFDGSTEAVAAEFGQPEFLAVIGGQGDGHNIELVT